MDEDITKKVFGLILCAVILEVNIVGSNPRKWWIDTLVTRHVYSNEKIFATFEKTENKEKKFMKNSPTSKIKGQGNEILHITYGK